MRIIAGKYKRKPLKANPGKTTRPILDRAKQMLFDRLEEELELARVLDVFSGTGSLGLEALSRGAASCVFVEQDHKAHQLLQENIETLGVEEQTLCWRTDALRCSYRPKGVPDLLPFDIIFFDPPYPLAEKQMEVGTPLYKVLERFLSHEVTAQPTALLVFRVPNRLEPILPEDWEKTDLEISVGSMKLLFYEKAVTED